MTAEYTTTETRIVVRLTDAGFHVEFPGWASFEGKYNDLPVAVRQALDIVGAQSPTFRGTSESIEMRVAVQPVDGLLPEGTPVLLAMPPAERRPYIGRGRLDSVRACVSSPEGIEYTLGSGRRTLAEEGIRRLYVVVSGLPW